MNSRGWENLAELGIIFAGKLDPTSAASLKRRCLDAFLARVYTPAVNLLS
jgi:hypothetical protein